MGRSLLFCAALCALLMGCVKPEPEIIEKPVPVSVHVPDSIRWCPELPVSTDYVAADPSEEAWQSEVAEYTTELHRVARHCRGNLMAVDGILDDHEASE